MSDTTTADSKPGQPLGLPLNDLLGQTSVAPGPTGYSIEAVQVCVEAAYKAGRAAERERCAALCESAPFTGNTFPVTQMEQLRRDIAAAILGPNAEVTG